MSPCTELTKGHQQINVIASYIGLGHFDDCSLQRHFTMMISCMLRNITRELCNLYLRFEVPLETREQNLPLPRLKSITHMRNCSLIIRDRKVNKLKIDEILISEVLNSVIHVYIGLVLLQPSLTVISFLLVEDKVN